VLVIILRKWRFGYEKEYKHEDIFLKMVPVKVKKLKGNAIVPSYAHPGDAAMDLHSAEDYIVPAGKRQLVSTGIAMEFPEGYWANIRGKSGLAFKKGISILGGVIEYTYRGEYGVVILNTSDENFEIKVGDKIAQIVIAPVAVAEIEVVDELLDSVRGEGAWGSTGGSNV
jgi:dUTP pyrophosphatase